MKSDVVLDVVDEVLEVKVILVLDVQNTAGVMNDVQLLLGAKGNVLKS